MVGDVVRHRNGRLHPFLSFALKKHYYLNVILYTFTSSNQQRAATMNTITKEQRKTVQQGFSRPNRRFLHLNMIMPSLVNKGIEENVVLYTFTSSNQQRAATMKIHMTPAKKRKQAVKQLRMDILKGAIGAAVVMPVIYILVCLALTL